MTIAGNQGQNLYPAPDVNYPDTSFPQPIPPPDGEPDDEGTLIYIRYSWIWREVLLAAIDQLLNPATYQGDHDTVILALNRAQNLKSIIATDTGDLPAPYWDDETDVEAEEPDSSEEWYGGVADPTAPAGSLDFVESAALWAITGFVAVATFEVGGLAPAILFHTAVEKFILIQRRGDAAETIRYLIDNQDMKMLDTSPYSPGDLIEVPLVAPAGGGTHELMIVQVS